MKTTVLYYFLLCGLLSGISSVAQTTEVLDSVRIWSYDYQAQVLKPVTALIYTYNADGKVQEILTRHCNSTYWVNQVRELYTYDARGNKICHTNQSGGGIWRTTDVDTLVYDVYDSLICQTYVSLNTITSIYDTVERTAYSYVHDSSGHVTGLTAQNTVRYSSQWYEQDALSYDGAGNLVAMTVRYWDSVAQMWHLDGRYLLTYGGADTTVHQFWNAPGLFYGNDQRSVNSHTKNLFQLWGNNGVTDEWLDYHMDSTSFDANDNFTSYSEWQWNPSGWVVNPLTRQRASYTYDSHANMLTRVYDDAVSDSQWATRIDSFAYDSHDRRISAQYTFDSASIIRYCYAYDSASYVTMQTYFSSTGPSGYVFDSTHYYYHTAPTGIAQPRAASGIDVYPVPAHDVIIVSSDALHSLPYTITLTDIAGRTLITTQAESPHTEINVSELPVGIYQMCIVTSDRAREFKRVVISR